MNIKYFKTMVFNTVEVIGTFIVERREPIERRKHQSLVLTYYTRRFIERRKSTLDFQV